MPQPRARGVGVAHGERNRRYSIRGTVWRSMCCTRRRIFRLILVVLEAQEAVFEAALLQYGSRRLSTNTTSPYSSASSRAQDSAI